MTPAILLNSCEVTMQVTKGSQWWMLLVPVLMVVAWQGYKLRVREDVRDDIRRLMQAAGEAPTKEAVEKRFQELNAPDLRLVKQTAERWVVVTPLELGAHNWVLLLDFSGDDLVSLRIRTADSLQIRPKDGPSDVVIDRPR